LAEGLKRELQFIEEVEFAPGDLRVWKELALADLGVK
jgi:hypothetical protein